MTETKSPAREIVEALQALGAAPPSKWLAYELIPGDRIVVADEERTIETVTVDHQSGEVMYTYLTDGDTEAFAGGFDAKELVTVIAENSNPNKRGTPC